MTCTAVRAVVDRTVKAVPAMIAPLIAALKTYTPRRTVITDSAQKTHIFHYAFSAFAAGFTKAVTAAFANSAAGTERNAVAAIIVAVPAEVGAVGAASHTVVANSGTPHVAQLTNGAKHIDALAAIFAAVTAERHALFMTVRAGIYDAVPAGTVHGFATAANPADVITVLAFATVLAP